MTPNPVAPWPQSHTDSNNGLRQVRAAQRRTLPWDVWTSLTRALDSPGQQTAQGLPDPKGARPVDDAVGPDSPGPAGSEGP